MSTWRINEEGERVKVLKGAEKRAEEKKLFPKSKSEKKRIRVQQEKPKPKAQDIVPDLPEEAN